MPTRCPCMCPYCGRVFQFKRRDGLIQQHSLEQADGSWIVCPGSLQGPRNPETDKRPLWKDLPREEHDRIINAKE